MSGPARVLAAPAALDSAGFTDWGAVPMPLGEPISRMRGVLLHRDEDGANETGVWECTPGRWRCEVERDEFCQFLSGHSIYTADDGTVLDIHAGDAAFFPAGWSGECEVVETVRKTYMIR